MEIYSNPNDVIKYLKRSNLSKNTVKTYSNVLNMFFNYFKNKKRWANIKDITLEEIKSITLDDCDEFINTCNSPSDKNKKIAALRGFFKYIDENSIISKLKMVKIPERLPVYLNERQVDKFLNCSKIGENSERNYCIAIFFINIGLRLSELKDLNLSSIDKNKLFIIGKGNKERMVFLNDASQDALNNWLSIRPRVNSSALFLSKRKQRISTQMIQVLIKNIMKKAGIDIKKYSTHKLRHTNATLLRKAGASLEDIKDQLGHKDIKTTEIYAHVDEEMKEKIANKINFS
jgi:integrase/recombinase XerD